MCNTIWQCYNVVQLHVTMFDQRACNGNDVTISDNNRTTMCNSLHPCEMMLQHCFDDVTLLHTCYKVNATWRWCVSNYNVVHVCYDDCTMLQPCSLMREERCNNVQQEKFNVIRSATMYNVSEQCASLFRDVVTICTMMLQCMSCVQQETTM